MQIKQLYVLITLGITLTSCLSIPTQTTATTNSVPCPALKAISYSAKNDTKETVSQIREYNAVYKELCK